MNLYIIGNGFDLWHGIPSSYWRFREYVREHALGVNPANAVKAIWEEESL